MIRPLPRGDKVLARLRGRGSDIGDRPGRWCAVSGRADETRVSEADFPTLICDSHGLYSARPLHGQCRLVLVEVVHVLERAAGRELMAGDRLLIPSREFDQAVVLGRLSPAA